MIIRPLDLLDFDEAPEVVPDSPAISISPIGVLVGAVLAQLKREEKRPVLPNIHIELPEEFEEFEIRIRYR